MKYPTRIVQALFPSIVCSTDAKGIHLTFDDGPHPVGTAAILDILLERKITATFFLLGEHAERYPELTLRIIAEGHAVGNHTYSHPVLFLRKKEFVMSELSRGAEAIAKAGGAMPKLFRPPYGWFDTRTLNVAMELGLTTVLWSYDSRDFSGVASRKIVAGASTAGEGSILLFHDNDQTFPRQKEVLPAILDVLLARGSTLLPLTP